METILTLNCGSSSVKCAVINLENEQKEFSSLIEEIGSSNTKASWEINRKKHSKKLPNLDYQDAIEFITATIKAKPKLFDSIVGVGHRVVHGGEYFTESTRIDSTVIGAIKKCIPLAPLHNPANLAGITTTQQLLPTLPQVAVFDTAFHQTIPDYSYLYAIPYELYEKYQVRKYGFHGTSHHYVASKAAEILSKPLANCNFISAHLGNGCSVCAIKNGQSIDTSMGLTPLDGLIMGTRSGTVDPGLHNYLATNLNQNVKDIDNLLNKKSGLQGISELSSDMRTLEQAADNPKAQLAIKMFCYRLSKYIGAYTTLLDRLDALIFTGGIGENSATIRQLTLAQLKILGFEIDISNNENNSTIITTANSPTAMIVETNEELMLAKETANLIKT